MAKDLSQYMKVQEGRIEVLFTNARAMLTAAAHIDLSDWFADVTALGNQIERVL